MDYDLRLPLWLDRRLSVVADLWLDVTEEWSQACGLGVWKIMIGEICLEVTCYHCGTAVVDTEESEQDD